MRRRFIACLFLAILSLFPSGAAERPNILFCIADDWSYPHAAALGDRTVRTPNIDQLARRGAVFTNAFCAAPSCTPSRAAILTGKYPHQLEQGGNLWSFLPARHQVFPDLLEKSGYFIGVTRKGWGPGDFKAGGRNRNPAGPPFRNFDEFLQKRPERVPFFFWFGSQDPHRPYEKGAGERSGLKLDSVQIPAFLPDTPEIRADLLDYYFEIERFDCEIGELVQKLKDRGLFQNTIIIVTADNGMPFPRAKANLYDAGARVPLIIAGAGIRPQSSGQFVNLADMAPTLLDLAQLKALSEMSARSLVPVLDGNADSGRTHVFLERERHANVRKGDLSYPIRAVRTSDFLYVRNFRPERWPAGDPVMHKAVGPYGDCDNSPSKSFIIDNQELSALRPYFSLAFELRPAEELYHLPSDPFQTNNIASNEKFRGQKARLSEILSKWMTATGDPRVDPQADPWSEYVYFGGPAPMPISDPKK